jgi:signal transduction histidine kinase
VNRSSLVLALVLGAALTAIVAAALGMPAADSIQLAGIAATGALLAGAGGALVLVVLRRRSVGTQVTIAALTTTAGVAVGASAAAERMFISNHDLNALVVVLAASGSVGVIVSLWLGTRVSRAVGALIAATRRLGTGEVLERPPEILPVELAQVADELATTSRALDEARKRERALEASRRELVAWVSHDLRTPLAGIRAMAEALEDEVVEDPATVGRYHRTMRLEADRLSGLVDDLFELSRIHTGTLRLEMERASLTDVVSDAIAAAGGIAEAKKVRVEGEVRDQVPELHLSTPEMARVLRNLLENAIRHTPSDGTVSVEAGIEEDHAYVAVRDGCGGIPEEDLERVFDVAFRGQAARTPGDGGGGLGLAIARGLVEAHHGEILVRNEGPGCRFTVRLPLSYDALA